MGLIFTLLAALIGIVSLVAHIWILIEAFKDELWKGFVGLLCGLYLIYYALVELDHEYKWQLVAAWLGGPLIAYVLVGMAGGR
jgi:hypothetical protein